MRGDNTQCGVTLNIQVHGCKFGNHSMPWVKRLLGCWFVCLLTDREVNKRDVMVTHCSFDLIRLIRVECINFWNFIASVTLGRYLFFLWCLNPNLLELIGSSYLLWLLANKAIGAYRAFIDADCSSNCYNLTALRGYNTQSKAKGNHQWQGLVSTPNIHEAFDLKSYIPAKYNCDKFHYCSNF